MFARQAFLQRLLDFIWPPVCIGCERVGTQLCRICGNHLTFWNNSRTGLESLQLYPSLRRVYSAVEYIDEAKKIVKAVKFSGYWTYTKLMARLIVLQCGPQLRRETIDVLVPVPIHPRRRRERGFNQTEKLAHELGKLLNIPVDTHSLYRATYRKKQSLQNKAARQSLDHDFAVHKGTLRNQTLCLIDDVFTTGATLSACARAVEKSQPKKIIAVTFARGR